MAVITRSTLQPNLEQVPIQENEFDLDGYGRKEESSSFGRGVDQLQASLYAFTNVIGNLTGFDTLAAWGEEGVLRNIEELKKNPPEIHSWDDVDSLSEFGTYALEALGEQAPQLLMDVMLAIGGTVVSGVGGLGAVAARRAAIQGLGKKATAAVGKKLKRMVGEPNFAKFQTLKGKVPAPILDTTGKALSQLGKRAGELGPAATGLALSNIAQNTGETQMGFLQEDIDAPGTALLAGVVKGSLDTLAPAMLGAIAKKANVAPHLLPHVIAASGKRAGVSVMKEVGSSGIKGVLKGAPVEGVTETVQTLVDHIAMNIHNPDFDMFDEAAMKELWTAGTKGAIVGGALGGAGLAAADGYRLHARKQELFKEEEERELAAAKAASDRRDADRTAQADAAEVARRTDNPVPTVMAPESQETIDAQARAVADPSSTKDTMEVTGGSPQPTEGILPPGTIAVPTKNGVAYTTNKRKATIIRRTGGDEEIMGRVLYNAPGGKDGANGQVVVATDPQGNPIYERATNDADREADLAEARRQAPAGGSVGVDTVENAVQARMSNSGAEVVGYGQDVAPGKGRIMLRGGKVQYKNAGSQLADEETEIANEESAAAAALTAAFPNEKQREGARRILDGEYEAKPGVKEALAKKVKTEYDRILREQDIEPHVLVEELYTPPELDQDGEPIEVVDHADEAPDDIENEYITDYVDERLVEGAPEAPVTRVALNTGIVHSGYNKVDYGNSEQMAYEAAAANAEALNGENKTDRFQVRQKRSSDGKSVLPGFEIVELDGFDTEAEAIAAKANYLKTNDTEREAATDGYTGAKLGTRLVPIDPAVSDIRTVKRGDKWYNEEHMLPSAFASSDIMPMNRNISTRGSQLTGLHTEESRVDEFLNAGPGKAGARRIVEERAAQRGDAKTAKLVDESIIKFVDDMGLPYEFIGTDLVDLGTELLNMQKSTTDLQGQRFRFNAYTTAIAHLRARGLKQVPAGKDQPTIITRLPDGRTVRMVDAIVAGNLNFTTGKGRPIRLSQLKDTDDSMRARGQDSAQTPFEPVFGEGTIDPDDAQINLDNAQKKLTRVNRILAGIYTKQKEIQKQRLERGMADVSDLDAELKKLSAREKKMYREKHAALDTIEAFMDPDDPLVSDIVQITDDKERRKELSKLFNLKGDQPHTVLTRTLPIREEIAGRDGVEHSSNQREDGFLQESDRRTRADGSNIQKQLQDVDTTQRERAAPPQPAAVSDNMEPTGVQKRSVKKPAVVDSDPVSTEDTERADEALDRLIESRESEIRALEKVLEANPDDVETQSRLELVKARLERNINARDNKEERAAVKPRATPDAGLVDHDGKRVVGAVGYGKIGKTVLNFVNGILKELGMDQVGMVVAGLGSIQEVVDAGHITREQKVQIEQMFESDPTRQAVFVPRGRSGVIITRPGLTNDRDLYLSVVGHEVGHGVFNAIEQSIENPQTDSEAALAKRLKAAYQKEKDDDVAYADSMGEWFADKISARARNMVVKGDAGIIGRFFGKSVEMLRTVFNKTKAQTHPRFHRSIKFDNVIQAYKDDNVFARMQNMGYGGIESIQLPPLSSIAGSGITRRVFERGVRTITQLGKYTTPTAKSLVQKLFDLDNRLRMIGLDEIADLIYKATNTRGHHKAFWNMVETARHEFRGKVNEIFPVGTRQISKELVFWELVQELPTVQLSEKARQVRTVIKDFHNYMVMAGLPIGEVENYFPRSYDIGKILANAQEFLQILQDGGMTRADAMDTFEGMTGVQPRHTMEGYAPKRLGIMFDRTIPLDTARVLAEKGFLNADPMHALMSYMMKYTREAEHRRAFGGYHYLKDYVTSPTLARMNVVDKQAAEANNQRILEGYLERYGFFTPTTNPAAPPGQQAADFQAALTEAERRGFIRYDGNGDVEWIHPDAKLDTILERVLAAKTANMTPEEAKAFREQAELLVDHALDRADPLDPTTLRYNIIGEVRAYESLRTLAFSGLASIPEMAVAFARAKGTVGMKEFGSIVVDAIKNPTELLEFARAIGAVQDDMGASLGTEMWSPWDAQTGNIRFFRNMLPYMMQINGNDKIVNYSRMIGLKMGMRFLQESASQAMMGSARHIRYLEELNIDADTVLRWVAASTRRGEKAATTERSRTAEGADAKRVRAALTRFIDESVLRPNAPERPTYAHHPIGTFVFHLKTFAYSFNKRVNGGLYREMQARWAENPNDKMAAALDSLYYIAPMLFVFMAFGAAGDELRERIKSLGANGTWGANNEDVTDMLGSWADRTGLFTSMPFFDPIWDTLSGSPNANSLAFGLGPTASHLYDLLGDEGVTQNELVRSIPVISQMTGIREQLYSEGGRGNPYQNYRDTPEKT